MFVTPERTCIHTYSDDRLSLLACLLACMRVHGWFDWQWQVIGMNGRRGVGEEQYYNNVNTIHACFRTRGKKNKHTGSLRLRQPNKSRIYVIYAVQALFGSHAIIHATYAKIFATVCYISTT